MSTVIAGQRFNHCRGCKKLLRLCACSAVDLARAHQKKQKETTSAREGVSSRTSRDRKLLSGR